MFVLIEIYCPPLPLKYLQSKTNRSGGLKPADLPKLASLLEEEPCFPNAFGYSPVHHPRASNHRGSWRETKAKMGMKSGSQPLTPAHSHMPAKITWMVLQELTNAPRHSPNRAGLGNRKAWPKQNAMTAGQASLTQ